MTFFVRRVALSVFSRGEAFWRRVLSFIVTRYIFGFLKTPELHRPQNQKNFEHFSLILYIFVTGVW